MIKQKQIIQHDPDNEQYGDCYRTCLSCMLGVLAEDIPNFVEDNGKLRDMHEAVERFDGWMLDNHGVVTIRSPIGGETKIEGLVHYLDKVLISHSHLVPYTITGKSNRGNHNHTALFLGGELYCDPATGKGGELSGVFSGPCDDSSNEHGFWWLATYSKPFLKS